MRRFYALPENFGNESITLTIEETRHLRDVLRLKEGDSVAVFDGIGNEFSAEIETIEKKETRLRIVGKIPPKSPESHLNLTLAVAILKGEKFDWVIQKAAELGVTNFVPIVTKRTDVKLNDTSKKLERWRKIVLEASKQCGRARLMEITEPVGFNSLVQSRSGLGLLFAERLGNKFASIKPAQNVVAVIGSEGGWEDSEIEFARQNDFEIVTLGGRILRAETAVVAISTLLQNHFGDLC